MCRGWAVFLRLSGWLALAALVGGAARGASPPTPVNPAIAAAETRVALGVSVSGFLYRESFGGVSARESGVLPGFMASMSRLGPVLGVPDVYTGVVYDFSGGPLAYRGYVQGSGQGLSPYDATDHARFNHVEVRLGRALALTSSVDLIPFVVAGYQNWYRNVGGPAGYGEFYRAALAGVGAKLDVAVSDELVLSASAEGMAVLGGRASAPALDFTGNFGTSGEETVRLGADWRLGNVWHVFAGLGVRHFDYAGSGLNNGYYEPPSRTLEFQSEIGVAFGFR
ncbi:hypothetical protein AiwAL_04750 [Acidiphilium sp. AL]|nr:hypothetical protein [Acidiphilium sp. AL]